MGKIKKLIESELVGGTQGTDIYPITSTKAVYDANNKSLDKIIQSQDNKLDLIDSTKVETNSINLANPKSVIDGLSIREDGSTSSSSTSYGVIYVPIDSSGLYVTGNISGARYHALYDENMEYIEGTSTQSNYLRYVEGAKYAGCSVHTSNGYSDVMINRGDSALPFEEYNPLKGYGYLGKDSVLTTDNYEDGSVTGEKIADDSVSSDKINSNIFNPRPTYSEPDYKGCISELYIIAPLTGGYKYGCKQYQNIMYVRPLNDSDVTDSWQSKLSLTNKGNYEVYELKCTVAGSGVQVGDTIGYVVFKDIDTFKSIDWTGTVPLYTNSVTALENCIQINNYLHNPPAGIADGAVTTDKIADGAVTIGKMNTDVEYFVTWNNFDYRGSIEELYVKPEIIPDGLDLCCKGYNGVFYLRPRNLVWNSRVQNISSVENGKLMEIICHVAGNGVEVGEVVGYVTFKDKQKFIDAANIDTSAGETLDKANSTTLIPWGKIQNGINGIDGGTIMDGTITQEKIDPSTSFISGLESGIDIELPDEIIAVEDDKLQIFWRSIIHAYNPYIFDIISVCNVGKHYPRYYTFTPTSEDVGNTYSLQVLVRKNDLSTLVSKTTTIRVVAKPASPASQTNVLCIGASATAGGQWAYELMRRLTMSDGDNTPANPTGLSLSNISFVGRKTGTVKNVKLEATGGGRVQDYASTGKQACRFYVTGVTQLNINDVYTDGVNNFTIVEINVTEGTGNIRCVDGGTTAASPSGTLNRVSGSGDLTITYTSFESESDNPFWNNSTSSLDFTSYANTYCNGSIDLQIWHCGVNDIFGGSESVIPTVIEAFRSILRAYHTQFPNGKVIISSVPLGSPTGGFGANYGASGSSNYFTFLNIAQKYATALASLCNEDEFSSFTKYASVLEEFDCENGYPSTPTNVNNRQEIKENLGTNGVHPVEAGSYMVSDGIYRTFADLY